MKPSTATLLLGAIAILGAPAAHAESNTPEQAPGQSSSAASNSDTTDPALKALKDSTARLTAEKDYLDAQTAKATAQTNLLKAQGGVVTPSADTGKSEINGDHLPKAEATLLASRAGLAAGSAIRRELEPVFTAGIRDRPVLVITGRDQLSDGTLTEFEVKRGALTFQLKDLHSRYARLAQAYPPLKPSKADVEESEGRFALLPALTGASVMLDSLTKLGSFFATEYKFGSVDIQTTPEMYAAAVLRSFRDSDVHPRFYVTTSLASGEAAKLVEDLRPLQDGYAQAVADHAEATKVAADRRAQAADDSKNTAALIAGAQAYEAFAASAAKVIASTESFMTDLLSGTSEKPAPIIRVAQERKVRRLVEENALVLLIQGEGLGAYYTKKNLWTFLGGPPLYSMGGANVTYSLYEAQDGLVLADGVIPVHGGYGSIRAVSRMFPAK
jgi:hypothetical protein